MLGISGDSLETHQKFARENGISFPLLADEGNEVRRLFGGGRVTYIVDRNGFVRFIQKGLPDNPALLKQLEEL